MKLSNFEKDLVKRVATGQPNKEIADHFGLRYPTISSRLNRVFGKLRVRSRVELTHLALRQGWVPNLYAKVP